MQMMIMVDAADLEHEEVAVVHDNGVDFGDAEVQPNTGNDSILCFSFLNAFFRLM
jgi:hypothetical protein